MPSFACLKNFWVSNASLIGSDLYILFFLRSCVGFLVGLLRFQGVLVFRMFFVCILRTFGFVCVLLGMGILRDVCLGSFGASLKFAFLVCMCCFRVFLLLLCRFRPFPCLSFFW